MISSGGSIPARSSRGQFPLLRGFGAVMSQMGFLSNVSYKPITGVLTVLAAAVIGGAAAALPAVQAARLSIVEALRRQE